MKEVKFQFPIIEICIKILIFAALAVTTAVILRPVQIRLHERMEIARDALIAQAEEQIGRRIQYGSMGPSIFGVLDIRNLTILRDDDTVMLSIARLQLSYSLPRLLWGDFQDIFTSMRISRPVLNLDFEKDADILRLLNERLGGRSPAAQPQNFTFRIINGECNLSNPMGNFRFHRIDLQASIRENRLSYNGRWNAHVSLSAPGNFNMALAGRLNGEYSINSEDGRAEVNISAISGDIFRIRPINLSVFHNSEYLKLMNSTSNVPASLLLTYELQTQRIFANIEAENFPLYEMLTFTGRWRDYNPVLAFVISGKADLKMQNSNVIDYNLNFSAAGRPNPIFTLENFLISASGNADQINIDTLEIKSSNGDFDFSGSIGFNLRDQNQTLLNPFAPQGVLSISNFRLNENPGLDMGLSGIFYINTQGREISIFCDNITSGNITLSALDILFLYEDQGFSFSVSALRFREIPSARVWDEIRIGRVLLEGSFEHEGRLSRYLHASLRLDSFSVGDILNFAAPLVSVPIPHLLRAAAEDVSVTTEVFFYTDFEQVLYNAPRIVAAYDGRRSIFSIVSLHGTNRGFELNDGQITWENGTLQLISSVDISRAEDISFFIGLNYRDIAYFFTGMILDNEHISIMGSYGLQIYLSAGENGALSGYANVENMPFRSGGNLASLSFLFSFFYFSPDSWIANIANFEITGLSTPSPSPASIRFSGSANESGANIPNIHFNDALGPLTGNIRAYWDIADSYYRFRAEFTGANRYEHFALNGQYSNDGLELFVSGQGMQLSRFTPHNAVLDGSLRLSWESLRAFEAEAALDSFVMHFNNEIIHASVFASLNSETLYARQVSVNFSGLEARVPSLVINRAASRAETQASIRGSFSGMPVDLSMRGEAILDPAETWLDLIRDFDSFTGSLTVITARYNTVLTQEPFNLYFSSFRQENGMAFNLNGGPRNMIRFMYVPETRYERIIYAALSAPSPIRGAFVGSINSQTIDAQISGLYVDLASLWRLVPPSVDFIKFPAGIVTGDIHLSGSLSDPEFFGTVRAASLQMRIPEFLPEPIRPMPTVVSLTGTEMTFGPIDVLVGQGRGTASGWFRFDNWIPNTFRIDISIPNETPIPYSSDVAGVIAHGLASGRLIVAMEYPAVYLTGDFIAHNTEISLSAGELAFFEAGWGNEPDRNMSVFVDFRIRSGRRVEFFWPTVDFPMLHANADMGSVIHITADVDSRRFNVNGDVRLRSGEIFYLERNFFLREGTLFFRENETQFDPLISARAEIRDHADVGPVTISLILENAPLRTFMPRFVSSPPLSQTEIFALLGQSPHADGGQMVLAAAGDALFHFLAVQRFQRRARDLLGLDMLSMRTRFVQNYWILQQQDARSQVEGINIDRSHRLGNYFNNSTVFMGRYIGADLFGEALITFQYDPLNPDWGGVVLQPEIALEMQTPLFDIRFSINPLGTENWFMEDISFSLIWRRSF